eukprot:366249-Chlamydomonas_euryale.AAC.10
MMILRIGVCQRPCPWKAASVILQHPCPGMLLQHGVYTGSNSGSKTGPNPGTGCQKWRRLPLLGGGEMSVMMGGGEEVSCTTARMAETEYTRPGQLHDMPVRDLCMTSTTSSLGWLLRMKHYLWHKPRSTPRLACLPPGVRYLGGWGSGTTCQLGLWNHVPAGALEPRASWGSGTMCQLGLWNHVPAGVLEPRASWGSGTTCQLGLWNHVPAGALEPRASWGSGTTCQPGLWNHVPAGALEPCASWGSATTCQLGFWNHVPGGALEPRASCTTAPPGGQLPDPWDSGLTCRLHKAPTQHISSALSTGRHRPGSNQLSFGGLGSGLTCRLHLALAQHISPALSTSSWRCNPPPPPPAQTQVPSRSTPRYHQLSLGGLLGSGLTCRLHQAPTQHISATLSTGSAVDSSNAASDTSMATVPGACAAPVTTPARQHGSASRGMHWWPLHARRPACHPAC